MKKSVLILIAFLLIGPAVFADHPKGMGIGVVGGGNFGGTGFAGDIGLSLKLQSMPIFWGLYLNVNQDYLGIRATGDKYFTDENLIKEGSFRLDWYLGLGGYAALGLGNDSTSAAIGARLPIGLSWHITKEFELWLGVAPSLGLSISPFQFPDWGVPGELGIRVWLK